MQRGVDLHALCLEEGTNALNPDKYFANELRINKKIKEAFTKHVQIPFAPEQKRTVDIDGVPFTGVWDGLADKTILELKTGKALWTEDRVTTHGQLYCYAAQHLISEGVIPEVILITANTQNGSVKTFNLTPSESDVADAIKIIKNVWSDMGPLIHKRIASK